MLTYDKVIILFYFIFLTKSFPILYTVLKSRLKAVRKQNTDSFPSILKVFKVALSGCLGSCLLLQFTTQLENESCASDFCSINVQPPSDSDLCRLDSMDSYSHSEPLDSIDSYLPHSSTEGIRHRLKIR